MSASAPTSSSIVPPPATSSTLPLPTPSATPSPSPATTTLTVEETDIRSRINATDARQSGAFTEEEVVTLPLGGTTLVRTFDELALLLPGVAPPPQTIDNGAGPGVGAGVGSAGQFAVNGLRSRANNFTVDGSDNNDEDIGVRRQGFLALIPQPIESIKEYQVITLLAPAQFGRNIGGQVNAVSKSGGSEVHGTVYGFFNSSELNARNYFDTTNGNAVTPLTTGNNQPVVLLHVTQTTVLSRQPLTVRNGSGGKDSFTFGQGGFVLGGPLEEARAPGTPARMFYFISAEKQIINASQEESFAVPTVDQRGAFDTGATGIFQLPRGLRDQSGNPLGSVFARPATARGGAIFSLFPFPNNPTGIYGANTFTQTLPASGNGTVLSGKFDGNFRAGSKEQDVTARYNFTDDSRDIPATGGAIFSSLRPKVRTQNFSFFLNSEVNGPASTRPIFNQARLSYGRTHLKFEQIPDQEYQVPSDILPGTPFLLNAPLLLNQTLPACISATQLCPNTGAVFYSNDPNPLNQHTEQLLGPVGQVVIAGFSPVGVDVFNFPQQRVNNTYQFADELTIRSGRHTFIFGTDNRRSELNSLLPRNARPLITFTGAPEIGLNSAGRIAYSNQFIRPETFAAVSAASGFSQTLATSGESSIDLHYYQLNFYAQDAWRVRPNLSLSYGLRYEYNTPPGEAQRRIESTFTDPALSIVPGLRDFIGNRTAIYETQKTNFAPRIGIAYVPNLFNSKHTTVIRAGYGIFYDQILGAVVSQSRNVYPTYLTIDLAGGFSNLLFVPGSGLNGSRCPPDPNFNGCPYDFINPQLATIFSAPIVQPGTLNTLNPALSLAQLASVVNLGGGRMLPSLSGFGVTLPAERLATPMAQHYDATLEQQLGPNMVISLSYVGTQGRHLLRFTTPNLGRNALLAPLMFEASFLNTNFQPFFFGLALPPGAHITPAGQVVGGRPVNTVGAVNLFETSANSRYDALQVQLRGRFRSSFQYQASYTLSKALDDVSDVFDLAGASALPQDSFDLAAERGPANFDVRHRFTYNFIYDFPEMRAQGRALHWLFSDLQVAGTGSYSTGQPFTVNSIFDVNQDGNLTDRLNRTNGLVETGNGRQPLVLTVDPLTLLAPVGKDGAVGRNTFRAGGILELDLSVIKRFAITDRQRLTFRTDIFNILNRANFGIPVRYLEAPGFGQATNTVTPARRIQFALKYSF